MEGEGGDQYCDGIFFENKKYQQQLHVNKKIFPSQSELLMQSKNMSDYELLNSHISNINKLLWQYCKI